jgi:signal transduction histidine kinase
MGELVWYRSLYWRIALTFVALITAVLVIQTVVFLWITGRAAEFFGESSAAFAQSIATDLSEKLSADPSLDVEAYLLDRHSNASRAFVVAFTDGQAVLSRRVPPPPNTARTALNRLRTITGVPGGRTGGPPAPVAPGGTGFGGGADQGSRGGGGPGRRGGGPPLEFALVDVNGTATGIVAAPVGAPPLSIQLRAFGPMLAAIGIGLLVGGTAIAALLVFRPTHRRLAALQLAARDIGSGKTAVRADETGGDEVASLARAFNEMAGDLEARRSALAAAEETRRQLFADVSHELMTPLAAIRGYVETMAMATVTLDAATRQRYLGIVEAEADRLAHILGDLLDLARLEGGGAAWAREAVAAQWLVDRVRDRHGPILDQKRISLTSEIAPDALTITGDPMRLEQALQNLAANALRHTPDGGRVHISAKRANATVTMIVDDSGPGIPPEQLARIFDRFYKVDTSRTGTSTPSGSGLGLSIVQAIAQRHGGRVTATNGPLGGARFELVIPD